MANTDKAVAFIESFDDEQLKMMKYCVSAVAPVVQVVVGAFIGILTDEQKQTLKEVMDEFG